jgi:ATP-dependent exoDNAse (exonuclease V) alpha subunit
LRNLGGLANSLCDISIYFKQSNIEAYKFLEEYIDDPQKEAVLNKIFKLNRVALIYGAAGTGKTTLINYIVGLVKEKRKIFIAQTNAAVQNMKQKIKNIETYDIFCTVNKFKKEYSINPFYEFDLIVVDECSVIENSDVLVILNNIHKAALVLAGDIYQIESIGFGNWFELAKSALPNDCCYELTTPHRSKDIELLKLWKEVRSIKSSDKKYNLVLEKLVRGDKNATNYSNPIDTTIFEPKDEKEIILCLNYNGLYGLNNINRLLQSNNKNKAFRLGILEFKEEDPVLFNDSNRFESLYNNLSGVILNIEDKGTALYFEIQVDIPLDKDRMEDGLSLISSDYGVSIVGFEVARRKPNASDYDDNGMEHILPFQVSYAVSIHKSQGLEYSSVKIVIADDFEEMITHNIFYTAITRAKEFLTIYWSPEVGSRVLDRLKLQNQSKDIFILMAKHKESFDNSGKFKVATPVPIYDEDLPF